MTRRHRQVLNNGIVVLVVDDDPDFLMATRLLLESEGYEVHGAGSGEEALLLLRRESIDVALIDYWMPDTNGERLVADIRAFQSDLQIVLLTGYANERPPRELLKMLDIQGFCDKSEGPERLLLWADVATKTAIAVRRLRASREDLDFVLEATRSLHRRREMAELHREILTQAVNQVHADGAILALFPDALGEDGDMMVEEVTGASARVIAGAGSLTNARDWTRVLAPTGLGVVRQCLAKRVTCIEMPWVAMPLRVGEHILGFVALKVVELPRIEMELLDVLAHQASVSIQNALYYEMAALDTLTGVHARRFFEVWTRREVRAALRTGSPLGLLLIDMDGLKAINDQGGHRVGDLAIAAVGRVLRETTREHDLAARLGGDEFAMLMPTTDVDGADAVARRILELLREKQVLVQGQPVHISASIGVAVLQSRGACPSAVGRTLTPEFFEELVERLVRRADDSLYQAKSEGRDRFCSSSLMEVAFTSTERPSAQIEFA
ncbi:MAG TPA: diguanylate cyclase [Polyangiaceae bacterium]